MKKSVLRLLLGLSLTGLATPALATDLLDVYKQALQSDPTYLAAASTRLATREAVPQSEASLLPNLSASANTTGNYTNTLSSPSPTFAMPGMLNPMLGVSRYNARGYNVTLNQYILNFGSWLQVREASATAKEADATFAGATQSLIISVAQTYFNVLLAQDDLRFSQAEKAAHAHQLDEVTQRFKVGLGTITTVDNAQAAYDNSVAQTIGDENALQNSLEALRQITGEYYPSVENFKISLPLLSPQPADVQQWVNAAQKNNLSFLATKYATLAARENIKVNFAGHFPTLSAVASYGRLNGQDLGHLNSNTGAVGLQLNVPIYQGGLVNSQTRQAEDNYATASANMENAYRAAEVTTREQFNNTLSGISKIEADREEMLSAQRSLDSTEESFKIGTRTIIDVLISQQNFYQAARNQAQDEYTYLLATLMLKQAAGSLNAGDLAKINTWLHTSTTNNTK